MRQLNRGHAALRLGRTSIPYAEYFLTICTDVRRKGLAGAAIAPVILGEMHAMDADKTWQLRCAVVMPNHIHIFMTLGERLSLGKSIARLKSKTKPALSKVSLEWERNYFDHHVRADEDHLSLFLYIFLNPYRAALCAPEERWPWFYCRDEDWAWFSPLLDADRPPPEWLK